MYRSTIINSTTLPAAPDAMALVLEAASGQEQTRLLAAGRKEFRGPLFQALLDRAREHLATATPEKADPLLAMATTLLRFSADDNARAKGFFAVGMLRRDFGQFDSAIAAYRRAAQLFRRSGVVRGEARVQANWGQALATVGRLRAAIRRYHRALRLAERNDETRLIAQINNNLGNAYLKAGDFRRAYATFTTAASQAETVQYHELASLAQGNRGLAAFELGRFEAAAADLVAASALAHQLGDHYHEAGYLGSLGNTLRALGRLREAESYFRQALALARKVGDPQSEELALGNLGILLFQMGWMNEAIASLEAAHSLSLSLGKLSHAANDAYHLGIAYREIGDQAAATAFFRESLALADQGGDVAQQTGALQALAYQAINRGDWAAAGDYLQQAEMLKPYDLDIYNTATLQSAWGYWFYGQAQYSQAAARWSEAIQLDEKAENPFSLLTDRLNYGAALLMSGRLAEAEAILQAALQQAQTLGLPDEERVIWEALGQAHELRGDIDQARVDYRQAIEAVESGRGQLTAEAHRLGFFGSRQGPYVRLVQLLVRMERAAEAWAVAEQARARVFVDALALTAIRPPATLPAALIHQEQEALAMLRLRQREITTARDRNLSAKLPELGRLRRDIEALLSQLDTLSPEYATLRHGKPLSWVNMQEALAR